MRNCKITVLLLLHSSLHIPKLIFSLLLFSSLRHGGGFLQGGRRRTEALQAYILREGQGGGAAETSAADGTFGKGFPAFRFDGLRRDLRSRNRGQPRHP